MDEKKERMEKAKENYKINRAVMRGPGPSYKLPPTVGFAHHDATRRRNPAWSMAQRLDAARKPASPGPIYRPPAGVTRFGPAPAIGTSLGARLPDIKTFETPAPNTYAPENFAHLKGSRPPKWSLAGRTAPFKVQQTPGPNQYSIPTTIGRHATPTDTRSAPAFSLGARLDVAHPSRSPGPATYGAVSPTVDKRRPPAYSLRPRVFPPDYWRPDAPFLNPADVTRRKPPAFSFGERHSEFSSPMILAADDGYERVGRSPGGEPRKAESCQPRAPSVCPCPA